MTSTSRAAPPWAAAATADADDPVPDDVDGPTPRSQIRMRTRSRASTCASSTLVPAGKIACAESAGPNRLKRSASGFFFQAEDGIRDYKVTGVQTCALPI